MIAYSGLRRGEAVGLRWEDVDFDTGVIEIRQQITQIGWQTEITPTKTEAGERTFIAVPEILDALAAERTLQQQRRDAAGAAWLETGLVFTCDCGAALHPSEVTKQFKDLIKAAGLPPIRLHDLRHGTATHALTAGVPIKIVSDLLGHSGYLITADTYTSVADEAKRTAAHAIADLFAKAALNVTNKAAARAG
jgi:integrase